ncbi:MAG TPA: glycosyltransferase family 4 protein [Desulfobacteraceae bacterium]|nr:glycosyltransferase family 4 protein [Desulfobacteraceae bacterium]HPQ27828.1 glycosyltransferase family 4 protein [Desulfobacteraceae bacterium]
MRVLIINQFASAPEYCTGAGERHFYIASKLKDKGYDFTILSGSTNHLFIKDPPSKKIFNEELIEGGRFIWVRLRKYKGESFAGRTVSWIEFLIKLFFFKFTLANKPDIVIVSSMSLLPVLYATYLRKRLKIPFVLEIRDIWPLTPIEIGGFSNRNPLIWAFELLEKYAYRRADAIISLMPDFKAHLERTIKKSRPVYWIPNAIEQALEVNILNSKTSSSFGVFTIAYAGTLGNANAMECFIKAADFLKNEEIIFLIIGDGPEKSNLQRLANLNSKVKFIDKVPKNEVLSILSNVNVGFISWHGLHLYDYGVSANKYNDYMIAGLPIISASNIPSEPVMVAKCGLQVPAGSEKSIADAIMTLYKMSPEERKALGRNGYDYVLRHNTYEQVSELYEKCILELNEKYSTN